MNLKCPDAVQLGFLKEPVMWSSREGSKHSWTKKKRHQWYAVLHKIAIPLSGQIGNMFENSII